MSASPDALLDAAVAELASSAVGSCAATVAAFDATTQGQLTRQDEIAALVDAARNEISRTRDVAFPEVLAQARVRRCRGSSRARASQHAHAPVYTSSIASRTRAN